MRRLTPSVMASLALALGLGGPGLSSASAAVGDQMLANPGLEAPDATGTAPAWWTPSAWTTTTPPTMSAFTWSTDAHTGAHSARVDISGYGDGDR